MKINNTTLLNITGGSINYQLLAKKIRIYIKFFIAKNRWQLVYEI